VTRARGHCRPVPVAAPCKVLADARLPISEYPQSPSRMTPACSQFYEAVIDGTITHSGDKRLARHVANAVLRTDSRGARIVKESKHSKHRIDLAVAAVMAHSRAVELARRLAPSIFVG
jgi:phage terminase large subunit-like protein